MKILEMILYMLTLKNKKILSTFLIFILSLKVLAAFKVDYSKIDELYENENFTIFLIIKEEPYRIEDINIVISDFEKDKKFRMDFDGKKAFVTLPYDSLPEKDFYYYFEIITKDKSFEYIPQKVEERIKNIVKFIKDKRENKKDIILILPENEKSVDLKKFVFSVYIPSGTKNVKIFMDGEEITSKCLMGEKILSYAPEKFLKPSRYRFDIIKDQKLLKTYYFNISNRDFLGNLFNGTIDYNGRYEKRSNSNFFNSYSISFYGNIGRFFYNFSTYNNFFFSENLLKNQKLYLHFNYVKFDLNIFDLLFYDDLSYYKIIPIKGVNFSFRDSSGSFSNISGEIKGKNISLSRTSFYKKINFYDLKLENLLYRDSIFYINFKSSNTLNFFDRKLKFSYSVSSPFFSQPATNINIFYNFRNYTNKFETSIDLKKYSSNFYILKKTLSETPFFYDRYDRIYLKNNFLIKNDLIVTGDLTFENKDQNNHLFKFKGSNVFCNINFLYKKKDLPYLYFKIYTISYPQESSTDKNSIFKLSIGTSYGTVLNDFDFYGKFFVEQTNYKFFEGEKKLSTGYNLFVSLIYRSFTKTSFTLNSLIDEGEIERIIFERYGFSFEFINIPKNFTTGLLTHFLLKQDFSGFKKVDLILTPEIKFNFKNVGFSFYPAFLFNFLTTKGYSDLSFNCSIDF
ncbi:MAG: hypothetical protein QME48_05100 [bacterium]|nr:hypothetical protein [bacterium]